MSGLSMGVDYTKVMFGQNAVHVPAWLVVQDQGDGMVSFTGASRVPADMAHPLRYGSGRTHQLVIGEVVVRPHVVHATDACRGVGIGGFITGGYHEELLAGERIVWTGGAS